jgi:hypothetical protein
MSNACLGEVPTSDPRVNAGAFGLRGGAGATVDVAPADGRRFSTGHLSDRAQWNLAFLYGGWRRQARANPSAPGIEPAV